MDANQPNQTPEQQTYASQYDRRAERRRRVEERRAARQRQLDHRSDSHPGRHNHSAGQPDILHFQ